MPHTHTYTMYYDNNYKKKHAMYMCIYIICNNMPYNTSYYNIITLWNVVIFKVMCFDVCNEIRECSQQLT